MQSFSAPRRSRNLSPPPCPCENTCTARSPCCRSRPRRSSSWPCTRGSSRASWSPARLTSLRRDEERSFRTAPFSRPYYVCSALTTDLLAPARGLLAVSTWPLAKRMVGPLSPRVDLLTAAIRLAEHVASQQHTAVSGKRVLWQISTSIPGISGGPDRLDPSAVIEAARGELAVHLDEDSRHRAAAAERAASQLDDAAAQLFGARLGVATRRSEAG